jgi:hypothetical protein
MQTNKPYLWVSAGAHPIVQIKVYCRGLTYLSKYYDSTNNRLLLYYEVSDNRAYALAIRDTSYTLTSAEDGYDCKVTVVTKTPDGTIRGSMTVKPYSDHYDYSPSPYSFPVYVAYCWMKFIHSAQSKLYIYVKLPTGKQMPKDGSGNLSPSSTSDDPVNHRRTITCELESGSLPGDTEDDLIYLLDASTGYDPIYEDIRMIIRDSSVQKFKTTSTESEADASEDDEGT